MITQTAAPSILQHGEGLARYYRSLAARLGQLSNSEGTALRTIGITSSVPGEGVTTIAANLAITEAASGGKSVLLVDANEQHPCVARLFGCDEESNASAADNSEQLFDGLVEPTELEGLSIVTIGSMLAGRQAWAASRRVREHLGQATSGHDLVIVDLPAATATSPCFEWAPLLDGVLLVLEAERASAQTALQVKRRLIESRSNLVGVVLNKRSAHVVNSF
jgi:protein-tyrosine kinase